MKAPEGAADGRRRDRRYGLVELLVALGIFGALQAWLTREVVRGPLPALDAPLITEAGGEAHAWRAAHGSNGHVLYVWATWCAVCKLIEGNVDAVARDAPVLTVAMQSGAAADVARHLQTRGHRWATINDRDGAIARRLGVGAVPTLIFVDRQGVVRSVTQGYTTELGIRARLWWAQHAS